jgi:DNA topoisomerase-1
VGFTLSPVLWRKVANQLSAGRVQSVALRLVVEREREILAFNPEEYWTITANLNRLNESLKFDALLNAFKNEKLKPKCKEEADKILKALNGAQYKVESVKKSVTKTHAYPPFTTSTLQQAASNQLGFPATRTMKIAQSLYEGIEIDGEHQALVTYIRTDSVRISKEAQAEAEQYIKEKYGEKYFPASPNFYKSKKGAQDAHEAIRPITLKLTPQSIKNKVSAEIYKVYKLIFERFLASQMAEASYNSVTADIEANGYIFRAAGRTLLFEGFTVIYQEEKEDIGGENDDPSENGKKESRLPDLVTGEILNLNSLTPEQKFTKPPPRYTDASLIKDLESKGIGRPSTYATILSVLSKRRYTEKESKAIFPTELGFNVNDILIKYFNMYINVKFTSQMEDKLDDIAENGSDWKELIAGFYPKLKDAVRNAADDRDTTLKAPPEESDVLCDKCGSTMIIKTGRYGKFLACPKFPECRNIKSLDEVVSKCPDCGKDIVRRKSKAGREYFSCKGYPDCKFISWDIPTGTKCPECASYLVIKQYKNGTVHKCSNKNCKYSEEIKNEE